MQGTLGEIRMFAGNFAPRSWAFCEGQLLPISQNQALFSILGTTYGGDGRTTFGLPDLRGRAPLGPGHGPGLTDRRLGQKGGVEYTTLTVAEMPSHTHSASGTIKASSAGTSNKPEGDYYGVLSGEDPTTGTSVAVNGYADSATGNMGANSAAIVVNNQGGNLSYDNREPYLAMNYVICLYGIFPSRG